MVKNKAYISIHHIHTYIHIYITYIYVYIYTYIYIRHLFYNEGIFIEMLAKRKTNKLK